MERYEEYKDSGVEWIEEIPVGWELKKLSYCFDNIGSGTTPTSGEADYYFNGSINWLQTGDLNDGEIIFTSKKITKKAVNDYSTLRIYPTGSLIIAMYGATIGKVGLLKISSTTNQACCVLSEANSVVSKFAFYWLVSIRNHIISLAYGGGQPNINQEMIRSLKIQLPSSDEQTAIANFLDRKTAEIDELITQKERLLELYKEERTAIINHAVTKGIDPNAELKDSGVEWIGDIPVRWKIKRFRYLFDSITEKAKDDLPKIGLENIENKTGKLIETNNCFDGDGIHFMSGDILFGKLRPYLAKVHLAEFQGKAVGDFFIFRSKNEICERFGARVISSKSFIEITNGSTFGAKMPRVSWDFISDLLIAYPNTEEQIAIANFLDWKIAEIDAKIAKTQRIIELQKEYRTTLIFEVITGKMKVSHLACGETE